MLNMNTGHRVHARAERANDSYNTPAVAVRALLAVEDVPTHVWEPCAGGGYIVAALQAVGHRVVATDLIRRRRTFDCTGGVDFLEQTKMPLNTSCIFTNPAFKIADKCVAKALALAPQAYLLLRVGYLAGLRWKRFRPHLVRVHVFSPRLPMMHRKNHKGKKNENSAMDFAWYVFDGLADADRDPQVCWLDWREHATAEELADVKRRRRLAAQQAKAEKAAKAASNLVSGSYDIYDANP